MVEWRVVRGEGVAAVQEPGSVVLLVAGVVAGIIFASRGLFATCRRGGIYRNDHGKK